MTRSTYQAALDLARQLTSEERARLIEEIDEPRAAVHDASEMETVVERPAGRASEMDGVASEGLGARFVAYLKLTPPDAVDRADRDALKQAIEEGCERVDEAW